MVTQILAGFVGALTFSYIYRVPASQRMYAGAVGSLGWTISLSARQGGGELLGVFLAAIAVAVCSEVLARRRQQPVLVFLIPGVIPLVPGGKAYLTMLSFLQQDYVDAVVLLVSTILMAGAVAAGIIITSSTFRVYSRTKYLRR